MKIVQIGPRISEEASGVSPAVMGICNALNNYNNVNMELHLVDPVLKSVRENATYPVISYPTWPILKKFAVSPKMYYGLKKTLKNSDILHNNSIWILPNIFPGFLIRNTNAKLVVSPHGTLSQTALKRSVFTKKIIWYLGQKYTVMQASCFHVTAYHEYEDIRRLGLTAPVAIIPNGIDIPKIIKNKEKNKNQRKLLFLSRIHPIKGIPNLLKAWQKIQNEFKNWDLQILGPDEDGYRLKMEKLAQILKLKRIQFSDAVYGQEKDDIYSSADLYVLPSLSENFSYTVAEALSHGIPVITTKETPWENIVKEKCGWWIDTNSEALIKSLRYAMSLPTKELEKYGQRGRLFIQKNYSWNIIGNQMYKTYQWLLGERDKPLWVKNI